MNWKNTKEVLPTDKKIVLIKKDEQSRPEIAKYISWNGKPECGGWLGATKTTGDESWYMRAPPHYWCEIPEFDI